MSYWKNYWNKSAQNKSLFDQVQRNYFDGDDGLLLIETHIVELLKLSADDDVLDVCCGNGLITKRISRYCKNVVGIDFSPILIENAEYNNGESTIKYLVGDAKNITKSTQQKFDKIILYFSFQYFSFEEGLQVVSEMKKNLKPNGLILLGDIPDENSFWSYYNTIPKRFFYFKQWLFKQPKMGKFWSEKEMMKIAELHNFKGTFLKQKEALPHAHYRFDFLLKKK